MSGATDQMIARYMAEIEERSQFVAGIYEAADGKDLTDDQAALVDDTNKRMADCNRRLEPLLENRRIAGDSSERVAQLAKFMQNQPGPPAEVEYRSAGEYILDFVRSSTGSEEAKQRMSTYNRAAAHQTTADNPGLLPTPILGPVLNFIDAARPVVNALGPRQLPTLSFSRPKVTQHTTVDVQSAEKAELVSQKMTISKLAITPATIGGYLNLSRQDLDYSQPGILDIVIQDLAAQYAIKTEATAVQAFYTGGTAGTVVIPASPTADNISAAFWGAAAQVYTGTKGQGRVLAAASPDVLGILGPLFVPMAPTNPNASSGFSAGSFGLGAMGSIGGIPVYVTAGFGTTKRLMVMSSAAGEIYEDRIGALQVVEPSVLGLQVAWAGVFASLITEATGIIKVTVT